MLGCEGFEACFEVFEVLEVFVGFLVLGLDTGAEVVEPNCEDGDVACRVWVFTHGFLPKRVVFGVGWTPVEAYLIRINEVVEVILDTKKKC